MLVEASRPVSVGESKIEVNVPFARAYCFDVASKREKKVTNVSNWQLGHEMFDLDDFLCSTFMYIDVRTWC